MFNECVFVGRIAEPSSKTNAKGGLYIKFGLALQEKKDGPTSWANCILGGNFSTIMQPKLHKGQLVLVRARMSTSKGQDGKTYTSYFVDTMRILSEAGSIGQHQNQPQGQQQQPPAWQQQQQQPHHQQQQPPAWQQPQGQQQQPPAWQQPRQQPRQQQQQGQPQQAQQQPAWQPQQAQQQSAWNDDISF